MKVFENGTYREATADEVADILQIMAPVEQDYDEAVNFEIRKRYTESQEFAVLRQKDEKPDEYAAYYNYCEECKAYVKAMQQKEET